ncbi:MAG: hypothetical protein NT166_18150 [Candidatus Aminicenantes bacterium]|nr:hypothetical protein [Candidatus Aminicenantes bacterium]
MKKEKRRKGEEEKKKQGKRGDRPVKYFVGAGPRVCPILGDEKG